MIKNKNILKSGKIDIFTILFEGRKISNGGLHEAREP